MCYFIVHHVLRWTCAFNNRKVLMKDCLMHVSPGLLSRRTHYQNIPQKIHASQDVLNWEVKMYPSEKSKCTQTKTKEVKMFRPLPPTKPKKKWAIFFFFLSVW